MGTLRNLLLWGKPIAAMTPSERDALAAHVRQGALDALPAVDRAAFMQDLVAANPAYGIDYSKVVADMTTVMGMPPSAMAATGPAPARFTTVASDTPVKRKAGKAFERLADELPFKVAAMIEDVALRCGASTGERGKVMFVVRFRNGGTLDFEADGFPDDAAIARICLECP